MAIVDRTQDILVPYSLDNTFEALKKALQKLGEFKVKRFDENTKTVYLNVGVSWLSWGENIIVSLAQAQTGGTSVFILSTPKTGIFLGGAIDFGKNRDNIKKIEQTLSSELNNYTQIS